MSDNIFGLDVLLKQKETGLVRYSSRMYEKDWDRLINLRRHKVVELGDRSYNNTSAIEEAVEILQSKYDIPRGETPTKLVSGRRGREVKHKSKDTSIMLSKETVDYIKDFLAYKAYVPAFKSKFSPCWYEPDVKVGKSSLINPIRTPFDW